MNTARICPSCQKPLPPESVRELCPECLMKAGFESSVGPSAGARRFVPPTIEELAKAFPQLEILELLGQGGMGAVYKARQPALDRFVALKILPPEATAEPGFTERFAREARALARLNHPNIVSVYDFGTAGGFHYLLMEYVEGVNLRQMVRAGRLSPREALQIVPQICDALQFAHDEGVVHRDIKPENILVDRKGRVKIADFGLAKLLGHDAGSLQLTGAREVMGTPNYMAPEQIEQPHSVDHRADIFSLGVVFYELLTGELPIGKFAPPSRKVEVDVRLDEVVLHTLEKEPARRYQHASQVKTDIVAIAQTPGAAAVLARGTGSPVDAQLAAVRQQVKGPATGLLVAAVVNWVAISVIAYVLAAFASRTDALEENTPPVWIAFAALGLSSVMLVASLKMRRLQTYWLAIVGSVLAMVVTPGNLIGLPVGIWSLVVLSQRQVRTMFGKEHPLPPATEGGPNPGGIRAWKYALLVLATLVLLGVLLIGSALVVSLVLPTFQRAKAKAAQFAAIERDGGVRPGRQGRAEPSSASRFSSPIEVVLNEANRQAGSEGLDLDEGQLVSFPPDLSQRSGPEQEAWAEEQGVDLVFERAWRDNARQLRLVGHELELTATSDAEWLEPAFFGPPPQVMRALLDGTIRRGNRTVYVLSTNTAPPLTFRFATADGQKGLLQVTAFSDHPSQAQLRFKRFLPTPSQP